MTAPPHEPFDPAGYDDRVVKPLRGRQSSGYPDELAERYAISADLPDDQLLHRVEEVRAHWAAMLRRLSLPVSMQRVYRAFQAADRDLAAEHGDELANAEWWRARLVDQEQERRTATGRLVTLLREAYGPLAAITPAVLTELHLAYPEFTPGALAAAAGEAGLVVTEPEPPDDRAIAERIRHALNAGMPARLLLRQVTEQLDDPEAASRLVLAVLDERLTPEWRPAPAKPAVAATTAPVAARSLTARLTGLDVMLSWAPGDEEAGRYLLVRNVDHEPRTIDDGEVVYDGPDTRAVDRDAPIAREVWYAVFAGVRDADAWSAPCATSIEVLPPVVLRDAKPAGHRLRMSWRVQPRAVAVRIVRIRPDGDRHETILRENLDTFDDEFVPESPSWYEIRPVYEVDGAEVPGEVFRYASSDTQLFQQHNRILELALESATIEHTPRVQASWPLQSGHDVRVRFSATPCPWQPGDRISAAELNGFGTELRGERVPRGATTVLTGDVAPGRLTYVAFAAHGDEIVVGHPVSFTALTPVADLGAERRGGEILVSWIWPEGIPEVSVRWSGPDGSDELTLSRHDYDVHGCRIRYGTSSIEIEVRAMTRAPGPEPGFSLPATTRLPARLPRLGYSVQLRGAPWSRTRKAVVTLTALDRIEPCELLVGVSRQADDLEVLLRFFVTLDKDATEDRVLELTAPHRNAELVCVPAIPGTVTVIAQPLDKPR
ncbi:hypothetical protein [Amycolatopsis sp. GM8]|uniref:hypothetical protein n=1 Tax=Amycolatopsis sp. GM8 TaxID=2896530 RepID=UPI001F41B601|nr:hypothetical protein [Amycolatopsis sp. GM8]